MASVWLYPSFSKIIETVEAGDDIVFDPSLDPNSIRLYDNETPLSIVKLPNYRGDPLVEVTYKDITKSGYLTGGEDISIVDQDGTKTTFRKYDTIVYADRISRFPRYRALNTSGPVTASYIVTGLSWLSQGTVTLDDQEQLNTLTLYAVINNDLDYVVPKISNLTLVSSHVPRVESAMALARSVSIQQDRGPGQDEGFKDYMKFPVVVDGDFTLPSGILYYPLLSTQVLKSKRVYFVPINNGDVTAQVGYIFDAPDDLPESSLEVQALDGMFIGNVGLNEKRKGESVRLYLGTTSIISGKSRLTTEQIPKGFFSDTRVSFTIQLKNNRDDTSNTAEQVIIRYYVGKARISSSTCKGSVTEDGYFELSVLLSPGQSKEISCSFTLEG